MSLLKLVEVKSGETFNGTLDKCDVWMNIHLLEVVKTSAVRMTGMGACSHSLGWRSVLAAGGGLYSRQQHQVHPAPGRGKERSGRGECG